MNNEKQTADHMNASQTEKSQINKSSQQDQLRGSTKHEYK